MKTKPVQILFHVTKTAARPIALGALLLGMLASPGGAVAQTATNAPPDRLSYQGYLVDANGNALAPTTPANYTVVFRIWTAANGGSRLWSEQQIVTVDKGNFSVVLGEGSQYLSEARPPLGTVLANSGNASDRYIGINVTINGTPTEILPRLQLLPTPYAFLSTSARNLTDANGATVVTHTDNRVEVIGNLQASGTIAGTFSGNGSGITSLSSTALPQNLTGTRTFDGPVGIGTTTPASRLHVVDSTIPSARVDSSSTIGTWLALGNSSAGGRFWQFISTGSANGGGAGNLLLGTGTAANSSSPIMTLNPSGNVGIGTVTPGLPLTFANVVGDKISLWGQSGNSYGFGIQGGLLQIHTDNSGGDIAFGYGSSAAMTEQMRIKGNGNVGIGTSTPSAKLDVRGDVKMGSSGQYLATGSTENLRIVRGIIRADGTISNGGGFTATRLGVGSYRLTFNPPFADAPAVTLTPAGGEASWNAISLDYCTYQTRNSAGAAQDHWVTVIAIGAR